MPAFQAAADAVGDDRALPRRRRLRAAPRGRTSCAGASRTARSGARASSQRSRRGRRSARCSWSAAGRSMRWAALPAARRGRRSSSATARRRRRRSRRTAGSSRAGWRGPSTRSTALGRRVVVVTQAPENEFDLAVAMARAALAAARQVEFAPLAGRLRSAARLRDGLLRHDAARGAVRGARSRAALCDGERCPVARDGRAALPRQQPPSAAAAAGACAGVRAAVPLIPQRASQPPSTGRMAPWMYFAAGEARNTAAPAMSAASPQRPAGMRSRIAFERSGSARSASVLLVSM